MHIHPIRTKADYKRALLEVSVYFDNEPEPGTEGGDRFEILINALENFESKSLPPQAFDAIYTQNSSGNSRSDDS